MGVRKIGPEAYVGLDRTSETNRAIVKIVSLNDSECVFRVANREPHKILVWNVRLQTKSSGHGWDTVVDDYPSGDAHIQANGSGEFRTQPSYLNHWRICVLYSVDGKDEGRTFSGNYEACSLMQEE